MSCNESRIAQLYGVVKDAHFYVRKHLDLLTRYYMHSIIFFAYLDEVNHRLPHNRWGNPL